MPSTRRELTPFKVWAINTQKSVGNVFQVPKGSHRLSNEVRYIEIATQVLSTYVEITANISRNIWCK